MKILRTPEANTTRQALTWNLHDKRKRQASQHLRRDTVAEMRGKSIN
jgi:hypothetical protein